MEPILPMIESQDRVLAGLGRTEREEAGAEGLHAGYPLCGIPSFIRLDLSDAHLNVRDIFGRRRNGWP